MLGNVVNNLVNTNQSSGYKSIQWNATNNQGEPVSAGVYLYMIHAGDFVDTKKMVLLKWLNIPNQKDAVSQLNLRKQMAKPE